MVLLAIYMVSVLACLTLIIISDYSEKIERASVMAISILPFINVGLAFLIFTDVLCGRAKIDKNLFKRKKKCGDGADLTFKDYAEKRKDAWLIRLMKQISFPSYVESKLRKIHELIFSKKDSPYYNGSLLGSLEEMMINWCDNMFTVYDDSGILKCHVKDIIFTKDAMDFLDEIIKSAEIPYNWIIEQEKCEEDAKKEGIRNINIQLTEVVKSMRADLEKIYNTKGENK